MWILPQNTFKLSFYIQFLEKWNAILAHKLDEWCGIRGQEFQVITLNSSNKTIFQFRRMCRRIVYNKRHLKGNWLSWRYFFTLGPKYFTHSSKIMSVIHAFLFAHHIKHNLFLITLFLLKILGLRTCELQANKGLDLQLSLALLYQQKDT